MDKLNPSCISTGQQHPSSDTHPRRNEEQERKYKGVRKCKWGKWVSEIRLPNSRDRIWLGSYDYPEKAARAFDAALFCLRGPAANFNFPDNPPNIPGGQSLTAQEIQAVAARFANDYQPQNATNPANSSSSAGAVQELECNTINNDMDWSFLNLLDSNQGSSEMNLFHEDELYPPLTQPLPSQPSDDDDDGDEPSLWNF